MPPYDDSSTRASRSATPRSCSTWLLEGDRTDLKMQAAVADVAHLVATHSLEAGDLDLARFAVEKAMLAAPTRPPR